jgi:hypothetical protein
MASEGRSFKAATLLAALILLLSAPQTLALDTSCSSPCFSGLTEECGGICPFQLFATAEVDYRTTNSSQLLCTDKCQAALYADSVAK